MTTFENTIRVKHGTFAADAVKAAVEDVLLNARNEGLRAWRDIDGAVVICTRLWDSLPPSVDQALRKAAFAVIEAGPEPTTAPQRAMKDGGK